MSITNRPMLVIATPQGQLGNTISHFAHIRAFAVKHKLPLVHLAFERFAEHFPATNNDLFSSYTPDRPLAEEPLALSLIGLFKTFLAVLSKSGAPVSQQLAKVVLETPPQVLIAQKDFELRHMLFMFGCALVEWINGGQFKQLPLVLMKTEGETRVELSADHRIKNLLHEEVGILFDGWQFRDSETVEESRLALREYFTPRSDILEKVRAVVEGVRNTSDVVIGVHIRRGDYAQYENGRFFWDPAQYAGRMDAIVKGLPQARVGFVICSDEQLPRDPFLDFNFAFGPGPAIVDMYALSYCDAILGAPSTFSGWAAFHGAIPLLELFTPQDSVDMIVQAMRGRLPGAP